MYEIYARIRDKMGLTDYKVSKLSGVNQSTFSDWKNGRSVPKQPKSVPLATIEKMGGWSPGSPVLRQIYIGSQEAELRKNMAAATAVFEAMQPPAQP